MIGENRIQSKKTTLVLTYNDVVGYPAGIYSTGESEVVVHSQDKRYYELSPEKLGQLMHSIYRKVDFDNVNEVVVYAGLNALDGALKAAQTFVHDNKKVRLVACDCQSGRKGEFAERNGIQLTWSECGGGRTLGSLVNKLLE